jgi:hypothetical protein
MSLFPSLEAQKVVADVVLEMHEALEANESIHWKGLARCGPHLISKP